MPARCFQPPVQNRPPAWSRAGPPVNLGRKSWAGSLLYGPRNQANVDRRALARRP